MSIKSLVLSALAFFLTSLALSFILAIPDEAFFETAYDAAAPLWRGEISEDPLLFIAWVTQKALFALGVALLYQWIYPALNGPSWRRGALFGLCTCPLIWATYLGLWTVFTLPGIIWLWWGFYYLIIATLSGVAMGYVAQSFGYNIQEAKS